MSMYTTKFNPFTKALQWVFNGLKLDEGGANEVSASEIVTNIYNTFLLAFKLAIQNALTIFNMTDGIVDEYEDQSGIDTVNSLASYYDVEKYYSKPEGGIDNDTKLMLHFNGNDGSTDFIDSSPSEHIVVAHGDAQLETATKKFGLSSLLLDGTGDYLSIVDSSDWNIFENITDNWTIDFWFKLADLKATSIQPFIRQAEDSSNAWNLYYRHANDGINFTVYSGGVPIIQFPTDPSAKLSDLNWHHGAFIKIGTTYAFYLDGQQVLYTTSLNTDTFSADLIIGYFAGWSDYQGNIDELRIQKSNIFNASPNISKTDTITVPTVEYIEISNLLLLSDVFEAEEIPTSSRIVIFEEDVDSITLNTDLKGFISRDGGSTYAEVTLADDGNYDTNKHILTAHIDLTQSGIGSGIDMIYKIVAYNNKRLKIHGTALLWD